MTVKDLKNKISSLPDDLIVMIQGYEWGWWELEDGDIQVVDIALDVHETALGGPHEAIFDGYEAVHGKKIEKSPKIKGIVLFHDEYK